MSWGRGVVGFLAFWVAVGSMIVASAAQNEEQGKMLHQATIAGDLKAVVEMVAAGADIDARDGRGRTALLLAVHANEVDEARALIDAGADVNATDAIQDTPFLYAGAEGRDEILALILATGRANLASTNRYGGTALIPAAHHGHPDTVRILLATGIDVDHVNNLGWTALLEAVILGDGGPVYRDIVGQLVDAGAKNIADSDGRTPLDHARKRGFSAIGELIAAGPRK